MTVRTSGLQRLPFEIMLYVAADLTLEEIFDLSLCSRHFQYLVWENQFCKAVIKAKALYSLEAQEALQDGNYARAVRRLVKRHRATAAASPYVAGHVGLADSYIFCNGTLCYIQCEGGRQRTLRTLDLRHTPNFEVVVDIPLFLDEVFSQDAEIRKLHKYAFRLLHHSSDVTSCLFSFRRRKTERSPRRSEDWLLIFNARHNHVLGKLLLESTARLFVRNNKHYLYFGTHSDYGLDGHRKWVLRGFDIQQRRFFPDQLQLSNVVGYEIGSTACFEVFDDYLYGVSNSTVFEMEEIDWVSYYYCFRFRLDDPHPARAEVMAKRDSLRRNHVEGPIDDRWGFLTLEQDESTGEIIIIEARKEWLNKLSSNRRTYYFKKVLFREPEGRDLDQGEGNVEIVAAGVASGPSNRAINDKINEMEPVLRSLDEYHQGDTGTVMFPRSSTYLRSYCYSCSTSLDLVDDPLASDPDQPRLRLRTGLKDARSPQVSEMARTEAQGHADCPTKGLDRSAHWNRAFHWPPEQDAAQPKDIIDNVQRMLNPPDHKGNIVTMCDDRSIVYATGGHAGGLSTLVYLSFDPAAHLAGMSYHGELLGEEISNTRKGAIYDDVGDRTRDRNDASGATNNEASGGGKRASVETLSRPSRQFPSTGNVPKVTSDPGKRGKPWARAEPAFHRLLEWKFTFDCQSVSRT